LSAGAYRAAGQAVAAILNGVAIGHVDDGGIELAPASGRRQRAETLSEIAIGLAGIAAVDRNNFGAIERAFFVASWAFDAEQLADSRSCAVWSIPSTRGAPMTPCSWHGGRRSTSSLIRLCGTDRSAGSWTTRRERYPFDREQGIRRSDASQQGGRRY
jgi:hypothetical protein